ncbi:MAG: germination protein YpeB [Clostridia bacterium]|nr:germination protein YpeB [Clostridia bacterium]
MIRLSKKIWLFGFPAILLVGLAVMTVTFFRQRETIAEQRRVIEAQTESAYRALSNDLNDLSVALGKLDAASTPASLSKRFAEIRRLTAGATRALSLLPVSYADDSGLMQFLTRTGDYADTLMDRVLSGQMLTGGQLESLGALRTCCADLSASYDGGCVDGSFPAAGEDGFYAEADEENLANYPTLLYDGPFSESSEQAEPLGLPDETVGEAEAARIAQDLFPDRTLAFDGKTESTIVTYDFSAADEKGELCVSITERGGLLLYFMGTPAGANSDPPGDEESERLHAAASACLEQLGFGRMEPSYAQYYAGTVVINYAAVQSGVILYADLVKVYVDRETERVIGLDTTNYRFCHRPRTFDRPILTEADAKNTVSDTLTVEHTALALIPKSRTLEVLCYECKCTANGTFFLVYVNAETGAEEEIFEVINSEEGDLVV